MIRIIIGVALSSLLGSCGLGTGYGCDGIFIVNQNSFRETIQLEVGETFALNIADPPAFEFSSGEEFSIDVTFRNDFIETYTSSRQDTLFIRGLAEGETEFNLKATIGSADCEQWANLALNVNVAGQ